MTIETLDIPMAHSPTVAGGTELLRALAGSAACGYATIAIQLLLFMKLLGIPAADLHNPPMVRAFVCRDTSPLFFTKLASW